MGTTIKDIARELGMSTSTVSYALNGGPRRVPDETRKRVLDAARRLNYRPNRLARSLITQKNHTLAIIPHETFRDGVLTFYLQYVFNGIVNTAEQMHYDVMVMTRSASAEPEALTLQILDGRVDGAIFILPAGRQDVLTELEKHNLPYAVIAGDGVDTEHVFGVDNAGGVNRALDHLFELGHRRIGHISGRDGHRDAAERELAYREWMEAHNLEVRESWVQKGDFVRPKGFKAALALLDVKPEDRPTAIFAGNDESALGVYDAARRLEIKVPTDLSIVGFDGSPLGEAVYPQLTTLGQPISQIASAATRFLINTIEGVGETFDTRFSPELIVRGSTTSPTKEIHTHAKIHA